MTDRLERIKQVFQDFRDKIAQCRDKDTTTADIQDAYSRLHRFRDRYLHEVQSPDPTERATVRKVFEGHNFINCGSPARFRRRREQCDCTRQRRAGAAVQVSRGNWVHVAK